MFWFFFILIFINEPRNNVKVEVDLVTHNSDNGTRIMKKENVREFEPPGAIKFYTPEAWKNRKIFNNLRTNKDLRLFYRKNSPQLMGFPTEIIVDPERAEITVISKYI